jgi:hypothetical protein
MLLLFAFVACESPEMGETINDSDGLVSFVIIDPATNIEYRPNAGGPYNDGDTIYFKIPSPIENPLDVSKLKAYCSIQNNCKIVPGLSAGFIDFTDPYPLTVITGKGVNKTNYIKVVPVKPKAGFAKLWAKFNPESYSWWAPGWIPSIEVVGNYVLVYDNVEFDGQPIKVYDRFTGDLVKTISVPASITRQICADDAGHFIVTRFNNYGAGFVVYYYDNIDSSPVEILNWPAGQSPVNMGFKTSVTGNLKTGKCYIYATTGIAYTSQSQTVNTNIYYWELNDGALVNTEPAVISTGLATWNWCAVQRKTTEANADLFYTYHVYQPDQGSRIVAKTGSDTFEMNPENHMYRIFDLKAFRIGNDDFLAISQQAYEDAAPTSLKVFDVTDKTNFGMKPGDEEYDRFVLMQSENFPTWNVTREGDVAVTVNGNEACIYLLVTSSGGGAGIAAYKMTYYGE